MKEKRRKSSLIMLYLSFHLNKVFCIIFVLIFIIWSMILLLNTGFPLSQIEYLKNFDAIHQYYFEQSLFFLQILNGVIVGFLIGLDGTTSTGFDQAFVCYTSRPKVLFSKMVSKIILLLLILSLEVILLYMFGTIFFSLYSFQLKNLILILYLFLPLFELILLGGLIRIFLNSNFISILIFIIHLILSILGTDKNLQKSISAIYPQIHLYNFIGMELLWNPLLYCCGCFVLIVFVLLLYQKKDL